MFGLMFDYVNSTHPLILVVYPPEKRAEPEMRPRMHIPLNDFEFKEDWQKNLFFNVKIEDI
jgi:hypothetical protein